MVRKEVCGVGWNNYTGIQMVKQVIFVCQMRHNRYCYRVCLEIESNEMHGVDNIF